MFTVEWLKDGEPIHREAMLGAKMADVLKVARESLPSGREPDAIRVTDHLTNQTTIEKITHA